MGCDYCGSIKGIGMKKSIELIKKHKTIEKVLQSIDKDVSKLNLKSFISPVKTGSKSKTANQSIKL